MAADEIENPRATLQKMSKNADGVNWLKFSVDNILSPNFGCAVVRKATTPIFQQKSIRRLSETSSRCESEEDDRTRISPCEKSASQNQEKITKSSNEVWPAWVFCTRYSDRPSSGPRSRRTKTKDKNPEEKRPRTAFSGDQLSRLKHEFAENRYLTERRRQDLARELGLNEAQIKIWFQNKRAKAKKSKGEKNPLALQLMAQGLYNHSTIGPEEEDYLQKMALNSPNSSCSSLS